MKIFNDSNNKKLKNNVFNLKSFRVYGNYSDKLESKRLSLKWLNNSQIFWQKGIIDDSKCSDNFSNYSLNFFYSDKNISTLKSGYSYIFSKENIISTNSSNFFENKLKLFKKLSLKSSHYFNIKFVSSQFAKEGRLKHVIRGYVPNRILLETYYPVKSKRIIMRKALRNRYIRSIKENKIFSVKSMIYRGFIKKIKPNYKENSKLRGNVFFHKNQEKVYLRESGIDSGFPVKNNLKRSMYFFSAMGRRYGSYRDLINVSQYVRHPSTQMSQIKKTLIYGTSLNFGYDIKLTRPKVNIYAKFYRMAWRYFKFKIEKFFYSQLGVRVHVWFLNIWDIFLNGVDSLWRWYRYESKTMRFLTKKGKRFFIEGRENAKFYIRTMTLTLTMVGGVKLFLDKISVLMRKYRNNWAFIISTMRTLRFCINFFWFRFFINYKITLQGKIGGFLRAQKKIFKKGNITIEDKSCAITYYRGYPVTKFGAYNLSFWLQYRIPNLIEKFEDMEYIDTMKILLGTYSVSWLAFRLAEIVREMLLNRIAMIKRKVAQYNRRVGARKILLASVLKKTDTFKINLDRNSKLSKPYTYIKKIVGSSNFRIKSYRKKKIKLRK